MVLLLREIFLRVGVVLGSVVQPSDQTSLDVLRVLGLKVQIVVSGHGLTVHCDT